MNLHHEHFSILSPLWGFEVFGPVPSDEGRVAEMGNDDNYVSWQGEVDREIEGFRQMWTLLRVENPRSVVWATRPESLGYFRASLWDFSKC